MKTAAPKDIALNVRITQEHKEKLTKVNANLSKAIRTVIDAYIQHPLDPGTVIDPDTRLTRNAD